MGVLSNFEPTTLYRNAKAANTVRIWYADMNSSCAA
jgi:hypothetical protein